MNFTLKKTAIATLAVLGTVGTASAQQNFPTKTVRILTTEAGGATDVASRLIAQGLTVKWGKQVIVENRPGVLAIEALIRSSPDGYSLLYYASGLWIRPLMEKLSYDPLKDVAPVSIGTNAPAVLAVYPALPAKSVKELIALAKAKPGELNYASGGAGSTPHLAAELFKSMAGVNIVRVPFKATGLAANAVVSGDVQIVFATIGTVGPHWKSGRLRALGITTLKPSALVPELPPIASVLPGYELNQIQGIFAPVKTPQALIKKIQQDIHDAIQDKDIRDKFLTSGAEPIGSPPEALTQAMKSEMARVEKLIKAGAIKPE